MENSSSRNAPLRVKESSRLTLSKNTSGQGIASVAAAQGIELENSDPHCELEWTVLKRSTLRQNMTLYQEQGSLAPGQKTWVNGPSGEEFMILVRSEDRVLQRLRFDKHGKLRAWRLEPEIANGCTCGDGVPQREPEDCSSNDCACAVCLDTMDTKRRQQELPCGHKFHAGCIAQWLRLRGDCPMCRRKVPGFEPKLQDQSRSRSLVSVNAQQSLPSILPGQIQPQQQLLDPSLEIVTLSGTTSTFYQSFSCPRGARNVPRVQPSFRIV